MPYLNPEDGAMEYRTLEDLIMDLTAKPGELFMRDTGCEALVYVEEIDTILLIECNEVNASAEVCRTALTNRLQTIKKEYRAP